MTVCYHNIKGTYRNNLSYRNILIIRENFTNKKSSMRIQGFDIFALKKIFSK